MIKWLKRETRSVPTLAFRQGGKNVRSQMTPRSDNYLRTSVANVATHVILALRLASCRPRILVMRQLEELTTLKNEE